MLASINATTQVTTRYCGLGGINYADALPRKSMLSEVLTSRVMEAHC